MLPGTEGIKLSQDILETADMPVIFLSVGGQEDQVTMVFDMGAVDCIVKPFAPTEFAARIRAALRKGSSVKRPNVPSLLGDLTGDYPPTKRNRRWSSGGVDPLSSSDCSKSSQSTPVVWS